MYSFFFFSQQQSTCHLDCYVPKLSQRLIHKKRSRFHFLSARDADWGEYGIYCYINVAPRDMNEISDSTISLPQKN